MPTSSTDLNIFFNYKQQKNLSFLYQTVLSRLLDNCLKRFSCSVHQHVGPPLFTFRRFLQTSAHVTVTPVTTAGVVVK